MMNRSKSEPLKKVCETVIKKEFIDVEMFTTSLNERNLPQEFQRCLSELPLSLLRKRNYEANNVKKKSKSSTQKNVLPRRAFSKPPQRSSTRSYSLSASIEGSLLQRSKRSATFPITANNRSNSSNQSSSSISTSPARSRTMSVQPHARGSTPSLRYAGPSDSLLRAAANQTPPQLPSLSSTPNTIRNREKVQETKSPEIEMVVEWYLRDDPARGRFKDHLILPGRGSEASLMIRTEEQFNRFKIALRKTLAK